MEDIFFIILKVFILLALLFCIFVSIFIMYELWEMRDTPSYSEIVFKFLDIYTGPIKEEKMGNKEKILSEVNFLKKELEFVQERYISICEYIDGEKMYRAAGRQDILSNEEFCDCLLQKNAAEEYMAILKRRLDRAFKREGL